MSPSPNRCIFASTAALAALAWLAATPSMARAECGDYVKIANPLFGGLPARHAAAGTPANSATKNSTPCHGPNCDRREPMPSPPAPVVVRLLPDQWAMLSHHGESADLEMGKWIASEKEKWAKVVKDSGYKIE